MLLLMKQKKKKITYLTKIMVHQLWRKILA